MSKLELHKSIALKVMSLAPQDRDWLLKQLPEETQQNVQQLIDSIAHLNIKAEDLGAVLHRVTAQKTVKSLPEKTEAEAWLIHLSKPLASHLRARLLDSNSLTPTTRDALQRFALSVGVTQ